MQYKIIGLLRRRHEYVSGEEIAERLKVSRQALWKHIQELKDAGFDIVAVPHLGYRLVSSPDRLFPFAVAQGLRTEFVGKKIIYFDTVTSTMDAALQLGIKGAAEGTIVLAESQSKGKGRLGRAWLSPKYKGFYLSLLLRPKIMPNQAAILTLVCGVSACEAIRESAGLSVQLKWPNDLLIASKKAGGILTELSAETDEINFVVIGIGLNVNNERKSLPPQATSLREQKKEPLNRIGLLQELLRKIEANYLAFQKKGPCPVLEKWREHSLTLGKRVKVYCNRAQIEGQAVDIDADGALLIRNDAGVTVKVYAGDVIHSR